MTFSIGTCRVTVGFLFVAMLAFFLLLDTDGMAGPGIAAAALHECGHLAVLFAVGEPPKACLLYTSTDGLTNYVEEEQIERLARELEARLLPDRLIALAKSGGGGDNVTVAVIRH